MSARLVAAVLGLVAAWGVARAQSTRTALVLVPERSDALVVETTARLCGELAADGFTVTRRASASNLPPQKGVETAQADADAVLLIAPTDDASLAIWLSDRLAGHTSMARLQGTAGEPLSPSRLSVRAVELLRARWSEHSLSADESAASPWQIVPAQEPVIEETAPPPPEPTRFGLGVGAALLQSSLGSSWLPVMRVSVLVPLSGRLALDVGVRGGGPSTRTRELLRQEGSVRIAQAFASADVALALRGWFEPSVHLAVGAYVMQADGRSAAPFRAHDEVHVSPLVAAGLVLRSPLWRHLGLALSADALMVTRPGRILVAGHEVARSGRFAALLRAELLVVF